MANDRQAPFKSRLAAILVGVLILVPSSIGMAFFMTPVNPTSTRWIPLGDLNGFADSGVPRLVFVAVPRENVWQLETGATQSLYVLRSKTGVVVFRPDFGHELRIPVVYDSEQSVFKTLCWDLAFSRDGRCIDEDITEDLHRVETQVVENQIFVRF